MTDAIDLDGVLQTWSADQMMAAAVLIAAVAVGVGLFWRPVKFLVTIVHEGGHALVGVLTGRSLHGIRLNLDGSGLTHTAGHERGLGVSLTTLAGYPAPALLGLLSAWLLHTGRPPLAVLLLLVVFVGVLLLFVRNAMGLLIALAVGGVLGLLVWRTGSAMQHLAADLVVWLLLLGSCRDVLTLAAARRGSGSDAETMARRSHLPTGLWVLFFGAVCVASTVLAGRWLLTGLI